MSTVYFKLGAGQPDFTTETQVGDWARDYAFGAIEPTTKLFRAPFAQLANSISRPSNLANYNINGVICWFCDDVGFRDLRGGFQEWTREVCSLPANFNDYETYSYTFPGYYLGRQPFTDEPTAKLVKEFFVVGNTALGANYATPGDIPQFKAQNYAWAYAFSNVAGLPSDLTTLDGYLANTNANLYLFASVPNLTTYQGWVTTDNSNSASYTIEASASKLEHYRGPIWMRTRRFVKAQ